MHRTDAAADGGGGGSLLAPNGNARSAAPARMATEMPFVATLRRLRLPTNQPELRLSRRRVAAAAAGQASTQVKETKRRTSEPLKGRVGNGRVDEARREEGRQETTTLLSECGRPRIGRLVGRSVGKRAPSRSGTVRACYL